MNRAPVICLDSIQTHNVMLAFCVLENNLYVIKKNGNAIKVCSLDENIKYKGDSSQRPNNLTNNDEGFEYYDTTLKKKILWNGTTWVNIDGTELT